MKDNLLKTRRGKLRIKLKEEFIDSDEQQIERFLTIVDEYEKDNLATIKKLKRTKTLDVKRINGALKQTINAHGPITKVLIGSATKRIYGSLLNDENNKPTLFKRVVKWFKTLIK
jgi:hypothetical protein